MLLDFHLAREPIRAGGAAPEWLGGTASYMSPEQRAALTAVAEGRPVTAAVDGRSDVYSLGVVLYEALGGRVPSPENPPPLVSLNPQVSIGFSDLIQKCLAPSAADRYPDAAALAADLRRHLRGLPLKGVANRSLVERWHKWRRRSPYGLAAAGMILVALAALLTAWTVKRAEERQQEQAVQDQLQATAQRRLDAERALEDSREHLKRRAHVAALQSAQRGLDLAEDGTGLHQALVEQLRRSERAQAAQDLHDVADRLRFRYGAESPPSSSGDDARLADRCRALWADRRRLLDRSGAELDGDGEQRLQEDLRDLGILWADWQGRPETLAEVEALFGPSPVLARERRGTDNALVPRTAWEHTALGRAYLRAGQLERAAAELERAVAQRPDDLWANFYEGVCAYRQKRYTDAVSAFRVCTALAPQAPECCFNRARAYEGLGRTASARADYDRALRLNPTLAAASVNRGLLHYREKRLPEAAADLRQALANGADPATVHYNLALVDLARRDRAAARAELKQALQSNPRHREAHDLMARIGREP
jgi:tetratricopeptide (TPR) repeat protein